jgi:homoserine dehydrogenase
MTNDSKPTPTGLALLGCGTVGTGVLRLLQHKDGLKVRAIAVSDVHKDRGAEVDSDLVGEDIDSIIQRDDVSIVVEVMGGIEPARTAIRNALNSGKHVVTANKALLAQHGAELFACAHKNGVELMFEAAVAGGIPVVRALRESLTGDRVEGFHGIINGTSNFVLTQMSEFGATFDDAVAEAQALGYAEADPAADVDGHDAAQKLQLLMYLGFGLSLEQQVRDIRGIRALTPLDFRHSEAFGYRVKPLAVARRNADGVAAWVGPALVPMGHMLANIGGVYNACFLHSEGLGALLLSGRGAGMMPTAVSVVGDIIECARKQRGTKGRAPMEGTVRSEVLANMDERQRIFYLRFTVVDEPGVLGRLASSLGSFGVSIERLVQEEPGGKEHTEIVVLTHLTKQTALKAALNDIDASDFTLAETLWLPVEDPDS